jgi:hypothetical protein
MRHQTLIKTLLINFIGKTSLAGQNFSQVAYDPRATVCWPLAGRTEGSREVVSGLQIETKQSAHLSAGQLLGGCVLPYAGEEKAGSEYADVGSDQAAVRCVIMTGVRCPVKCRFQCVIRPKPFVPLSDWTICSVNTHQVRWYHVTVAAT